MNIVLTSEGGDRVHGELIERIDKRGQIIVRVRVKDRGVEIFKFPSEDALMRATGQPRLF